MPGFVLQVAPLPADLVFPAIRVGFTVSRKVGEVARLVNPQAARADQDYVLVGRQGAIGRDFLALQAELQEALRRLKSLTVATP